MDTNESALKVNKDKKRDDISIAEVIFNLKEKYGVEIVEKALTKMKNYTLQNVTGFKNYILKVIDTILKAPAAATTKKFYAKKEKKNTFCDYDQRAYTKEDWKEIEEKLSPPEAAEDFNFANILADIRA